MSLIPAITGLLGFFGATKTIEGLANKQEADDNDSGFDEDSLEMRAINTLLGGGTKTSEGNFQPPTVKVSEPKPKKIRNKKIRSFRNKYRNSNKNVLDCENDFWCFDDMELGSKIVDVPIQILGGFRDAGISMLSLGAAATNALGITNVNKKELTDKVKKALPIQDPKSLAGSITRGISQFLLPFTALSKGARAIGAAKKLGTALTSTAAAAGADFVGFDEHAERLSDVIEEHPSLSNPITKYLKSNPNDSVAEGRLKNAVEGLGIGALSDALFKGIKYINYGGKAKAIVKESKEFSKKNIDDFIQKSKEIKDLDIDSLPKKNKENITADPILNKDTKKKKEIADVSGLNTARDRETIDIETQKEIAATMNLSPQDLIDGKLLEQIKNSDQWKLLNKATMLTDEAHRTLLNSEDHYLGRLELGDKEAVDDFLNNELKVYLNTKVATEKAIGEAAARPMGFAGHSMAIQNANKIIDLINTKANNYDKEELVKHIFSLAKSGRHEVNRFINKIDKAEGRILTSEMLRTFHAGSILSSPITVLTDWFEAVPVLAYMPLEKMSQAAVSAIRHGIFGGSRGVEFKEVSAILHSYHESIGDFISYIAKAFKRETDFAKQNAQSGGIKGVYNDLANKFKQLRVDSQTRFDHKRWQSTITAKNLGIAEDSMFAKIVDTLGQLPNIPGDLMSTKDDLMKMMLYNSEVKALAYRQATKEGVTDGLAKRVAEIEEEISKNFHLDAMKLEDSSLIKLEQNAQSSNYLINKSIHEQALDYAKRTSFTKELDPQDWSTKAMKLIEDIPFNWLIVPFKKTLLNISKETIDRTLLSPIINSKVRDAIMQGGVEADKVIGKIALGTALSSFAAYKTYTGFIQPMGREGKNYLGAMFTGKGPTGSKHDEREMLMRAGWRPYSMKIGNGYYNIHRYDPISSLFFMPARIIELAHEYDIRTPSDFPELAEDLQKLFTATTMGITEVLLDKSYTSGLFELIHVIQSQDKKKLEKQLGYMAGAFVPNIITFGMQSLDPTVKEINSGFDKIKAKYGGHLEPRLDLFGEKITRDDRMTGYVIPLSHAKLGKDQLLTKLVEDGVYIAKPKRVMKYGVRLTPSEYNYMLGLMKKRGVREAIEKFIETDEYKNLPPYVKNSHKKSKQTAVRSIYNTYAREARKDLLELKPEIEERIYEASRKIKEIQASGDDTTKNSDDE